MIKNEQLQVFAKCLGNPIFAIESFFKTFYLTQKGMVPFKLFYKQKQIINLIRVEVFERVRDLRFNDNQLYLFMEDTASIGVINLN